MFLFHKSTEGKHASEAERGIRGGGKLLRDGAKVYALPAGLCKGRR
ncbi:MAG: hypothetical protein ACLSG5_11610 [Oscillospiraceae bacterium]